MIALNAKHSLVPDATLLKLESQLQPELDAMQQARGMGYEDDRASINLPDDDALFTTVQHLAKKYADIDALVVVGIGGSNLGTVAVQEAVQGKLHNAMEWPRIFFSDTVDPRVLTAQGKVIGEYLKTKKRVIVNVISKSGTTTETVANAGYFFQIFQEHGADPKDGFVFTTDENSKLWEFAGAGGFDRLPIPAKVGGRYSVCSAVGLFPLALMGIDVAEFQAGAREMRDRCLTGSVKENPAALSAAILAAHNAKQIPIHDTFLFAVDLESVGKWYRQLMGESIGKEHDREGNTVHAGMTPTVSVGSHDLHSVVQLYLGGPRDKFTTFVRVAPQREPVVPTLPGFGTLVSAIHGKPFSTLMDAILDGTLIAYQKGKRPFVTITLPETSARTLGQLLQMKMMEMMFLGALLNVNPFDQPAVEHYKVETKRILAGT